MNIEHRRYTGPLRWDVCAECKEPWPCGPAVFRCELDTITAELTTQCTAERPFGPCTQRCEQPAGHDGQHRAQCFTWDDTGWTQTDETGETVAAVSYVERIDLAALPYTGPITDNQYTELFLRGEFYIVEPNEDHAMPETCRIRWDTFTDARPSNSCETTTRATCIRHGLIAISDTMPVINNPALTQRQQCEERLAAKHAEEQP